MNNDRKYRDVFNFLTLIWGNHPVIDLYNTAVMEIIWRYWIESLIRLADCPRVLTNRRVLLELDRAYNRWKWEDREEIDYCLNTGKNLINDI